MFQRKSQRAGRAGVRPPRQTSLAQLNAPLSRMAGALSTGDVFTTLPFLAPQVSPGLGHDPTSGGGRESGHPYLLNAPTNDNSAQGHHITASARIREIFPIKRQHERRVRPRRRPVVSANS